MGLQTAFGDAEIVVIQAPYDGAVSYNPGAREGPQLIIKASEQVELYDMEQEHDIPFKAHTQKPLALQGTGEEATDTVYRDVKKVFTASKFPILLGGDHSVSVGAVEAASEKYPGLTVLHIDAHADLRDSYDNSRFSHACAARRMHEFGVKLVQLGIRSTAAEEHKFMLDNNINTFFAPVTDFDAVVDACGRDVYISFDADGMDPSIIPATGTPVPGGLGWHETVSFLKNLFAQRNIVGLDFVELSKGATSRSEDAAALLLYKMIGYLYKKWK